MRTREEIQAEYDEIGMEVERLMEAGAKLYSIDVDDQASKDIKYFSSLEEAREESWYMEPIYEYNEHGGVKVGEEKKYDEDRIMEYSQEDWIEMRDDLKAGNNIFGWTNPSGYPYPYEWMERLDRLYRDYE